MTAALAATPRKTVNAPFAVALTAAIGLAITLLIAAADWTPAIDNRALHATEETVGALVLLLVAALLAGRVERRRTLLDVLGLAGVVVLATKNLVVSVFAAILAETWVSSASWRTTGAGMVAAALLAAAALSPRRVVRNGRTAVVLAAGGALTVFALVSAVGGIFELPGALTDRRAADEHSGLIVADVGASILFLIAGAAFARRSEREADEFQMWLGIGATIAAVGYLNYALSPSAYTDVLYAGDLFRAVAVVALGVGAIREYSRYQAVYAPAAVLEERRRMARDLHEGIAQELAFIASRIQRLANRGDDDDAVAEIDQSVRRALEESRAAIATLNRPLEEPLHVALAETARHVVASGDTRLELDLDPDIVVPDAWAQALPRMVREAVGNAVRHGRARTVTVRLHDANGVRLQVTDDGVGFDPDRPRPQSSFGLITIQERAQSLGGELRLTSRPGQGTSVDVVLP